MKPLIFHQAAHINEALIVCRRRQASSQVMQPLPVHVPRYGLLRCPRRDLIQEGRRHHRLLCVGSSKQKEIRERVKVSLPQTRPDFTVSLADILPPCPRIMSGLRWQRFWKLVLICVYYGLSFYKRDILRCVPRLRQERAAHQKRDSSRRSQQWQVLSQSFGHRIRRTSQWYNRQFFLYEELVCLM